MKNIIFIGLPGCGKTTISKMVAEAIDRKWYDSDLEIESSEGMDIPTIFALKGEEYFRERETECIKRLLALSGIVLSVGGGAVLRNSGLLSQNSTVIYLNRSIPDILSTLEPGTRPLIKDKTSLYKLYDKRHDLYERLCDHMIESQAAIEDTYKLVMEALK